MKKLKQSPKLFAALLLIAGLFAAWSIAVAAATATATVSVTVTAQALTAACIKSGQSTTINAYVGDTVGAPTLVVVDKYNASLTVPGTWTWASTPSTATAGSKAYNATFSPTDSTNYTGFTATFTVTVSKKAHPGLSLSYGATTIQYRAAAIGATLTGKTGDGTIAYTSSDTSVVAVNGSTGAITLKKPGSATIAVAQSEGTAYLSKTASVTITVTKADLKVTATPSISGSYTYGNALSVRSVSGGTVVNNNSTSETVAGTWAWSDGTVIPTVTNSGYSAKFTPTNTALYNTVTYNIKPTVAKATPTLDAGATGSTINYGSALSASTITATWRNANHAGNIAVGGTSTWAAPTTVPNAGASQAFQINFAPTDTANYNSVTAASNKASVTVNRIAHPAVSMSNITKVYTPVAFTMPSVAGAYGTVTWGSSNTNVASVVSSTGVVTMKTSGSTTMTAYIAQSTNYNATSLTCTLTVNKATPVVTWGAPATITYGQTLASAPFGSSSAYIDNGNGTTTNVTGTTAWVSTSTIPTVTNSGYSAKFTPTDTGKYNTVTKTIVPTVNKCTPSTLTPDFTGATITYGDKLSASAITAPTPFNGYTSATVAGSWNWKSPTTVPNASTSTQYPIVFTPTDTSNYNTVEVNATIKINKCTPTLSNVAASDIVYKQSLNSSTITGTVTNTQDATMHPTGTFAWVAPTTVPNATASTRADAQSFSFTWTPDSSYASNYNSVTGQTVKVYVDKASQPTISMNDLTVIYGDSDFTLANSGGGQGSKHWDVTGTAGIVTINETSGNIHIVKAGTTKITVYYDGTANYYPGSKEVTLTVDKNSPVIGSASATDIVYGQKLNLSTATLDMRNSKNTAWTVPGTYVWGTSSTDTAYGNNIYNAGTNSYSFWFMPTDTANYNPVCKQVSVHIKKNGATPDVAGGFIEPNTSTGYPIKVSGPTASYLIQGQALNDSTITGTVRNSYTNEVIPGSWVWVSPTTVPTFDDSTSYMDVDNPNPTKFYIEFHPNDTNNYIMSKTYATLFVDRRTPDVIDIAVSSTRDGRTLGDTLIVGYGVDPITNSYVSGTLAWDEPDTVLSSTPSGLYGATFYSLDESVYYNSESVPVALSVDDLLENPITTTSTEYVYSYKYNGTFNLGATAATQLTYTSNDQSIVSVDASGKVTIHKTGETFITISTVGNSTYKAATKIVTVNIVKANPVVQISASSIHYGELLTTSTLTVADGSGTATWLDMPAETRVPGTYGFTCTFTPTDSTNYNTITQNVSVTVLKTTLERDPAFTGANIEYGNTVENYGRYPTYKNPYTGASVSGTYEWLTNNKITWIGTYIQPTTFKFTADEGNCYEVVFDEFYPSGTACQNPVITFNSPITVPYGTAWEDIIPDFTFTNPYDGSSIDCTYEYSSSGVPGKGVKLTTFTCNPVDTTHYRSASKSLSITVESANPVITELYASEIDYGQSLSDSSFSYHSNTPGTLSWVNGDITPTVADSASTDYRAKFIPDDSNNYNSIELLVKLVVKPIEPTISVGTIQPINYGQRLDEALITYTCSNRYNSSPVQGTWRWDTPGIYPTATPLLSYKAIFEPNDSINYKSTSTMIEVPVNKATTNITVTASPIVYGQSLADSVLTVSGTEGTVVWADPSIVPAYTDSEKTLYEVNFTPTDINNHVAATVKVTVKVTKAVPVISNIRGTEITYGQKLSDSTLSYDKDVEGNLVFDAPTTKPVVADSGVTRYAVTFTPTDLTNYEVVHDYVYIVVKKATPQVTKATLRTLTYGETLGSVEIPYTATNTFDNSAVRGTWVWPSNAIVPTVVPQTFDIIFYPDDSANYNNALSDGTITVVPATPTIEVSVSPITYGKKLSDSRITYTGIPGTVEWVTPDFKPTVNDSGTTRFGIKFTPSDNSNYNTITVYTTLVVEKAVPVITNVVTTPLVYGQVLNDSTITCDSDVTGGIAWDDPNTMPNVSTNGAYPFYYTFTPTDTINYESVNNWTTITISKATPVITRHAFPTITYGTSLAEINIEHTATNPYSSVAVDGVFSWDQPSILPTVTDQELALTFHPTDFYNYNDVPMIEHLTVEKGTPEPVIVPTPITYGKALRDSLFQIENVPGIATWVNGDIIPQVVDSNKTQYDVLFEPFDKVNYKSITKKVQIAVLPCAVDASAIEAIVSATPVTWGQTLENSTFNNEDALPVPGHLIWKEPTYKPSARDNNTARYDAIFMPDDQSNYLNVEVKISCEVLPIAPTISNVSTTELKYGKSLGTLEVTGRSSVPGTFKFVDSEYVPTAVDSKNGRQFDVVFTPEDNFDYTTVTTRLAVKVTQAAPLWETDIIQSIHATDITYGQLLKDSRIEGDTPSDGYYEWVRPNIQPTVEDSDNTQFAVRFVSTDPSFLSDEETIKLTVHVNKKSLNPTDFGGDDNDDPPSDVDGDGIPDIYDPDVDGDGIPNWEDDDVDGDGEPNDFSDLTDTDGDGIPDVYDPDIDGDGIPNWLDPDEAWLDTDGDGIPDIWDPDLDGDGIANWNDPDINGTPWDEVPGYKDLADLDGNGRPDLFDQGPADFDGDGMPDFLDPSKGCSDIDHDGIPDIFDSDIDGDGIPNDQDTDVNGVPWADVPGFENLPDTDSDGVPDLFDSDIDGDGIPNDTDQDINGTPWGEYPPYDTWPDTDGDGVPDAFDSDLDGDGIPNDTDPDWDNDGIPNEEDRPKPPHPDWPDTDGDGIPDLFDPDIDGDDIPNEEDDDIDGDGVPNDEDTDYADKDTDNDGIPDVFDPDIDGDGIPNEDDDTPYGEVDTPSTELQATEIVYGDALGTSVITGPTPIPGEYKWNTPNVVPTVADSYTTIYDVTFYPRDSVNYNPVTGLKMLVGVKPSNPLWRQDITQTIKASDIVYGQTLANSTITGDTPCAGYYEWIYPSTKPTAEDSGTTLYDVRFVSEDDNFNSDATLKITVVVKPVTLNPGDIGPTDPDDPDNPLTPDTTIVKASPIVYGNPLSSSTLTITGNAPFPGKFVWENGSTVPAVTDSLSTIYYVTFIPDDAANYTAIQHIPTYIEVTPAYPTWHQDIVQTIKASDIICGQALSQSTITGDTPCDGYYEWVRPGIIPKITDSDTTKYAIRFVSEDPNYKDDETQSITVHLDKYSYTVEDILDGKDYLTGSTITYTETLAKSTITATTPIPGKFVWEDPTIAPVVADSETTIYYAMFVPLDGDAFTPVTHIPAKLKVQKANIGFTAAELSSFYATPVVYPNKLSTSQIQAVTNLEGTFTWQTPDVVPTVAMSNLQEFRADFTPTDPNYNPRLGLIFHVEVLPAQPDITSITLLKSTTIVYGQPLSESTLSGQSTVPGTFEWVAPTTIPEVSDSNKTEYEVRFVPTDKNYASVTGLKCKVTVNPATVIVDNPLNIKVTATNITYGDKLSASKLIGDLPVPGTYKWTNPDITPSVSDSNTTLYNVVFTPDSPNYVEYSNLSARVVVNKKQYTAADFKDLKATDIDYGDALSTSTISADTPCSGKFVWNKPSYVPIRNDSENTLFNITFVPTDTVNYESVPLTIKVKIADKVLKFSDEVLKSLEASSLTYGQLLSESKITGKTPCEGYYEWMDPNTKPSVTDSNKTKYKVRFVSKNANFNNVENLELTVAVNKCSVTEKDITNIKATPLTVGQPLSASTLSAALAIPGKLTWESPTAVPSVADSGRTKFNIIYTPDDTTNYNTLNGLTAIVIVNQYVPDISSFKLSASDIAFGESLQQSSISGKLPTNPYTGKEIEGEYMWVNSSIKPTVADSKVTKYKAMFVPNDKSSYKNSEQVDLTLNIVRNNPTITADDIVVGFNKGQVTLRATSNSNGAITYTTSDTSIVTIAGDVAVIKSVGTATVTAHVAATPSYNEGEKKFKIVVNSSNSRITGTTSYTVRMGSAPFTLDARADNATIKLLYTVVTGDSITVDANGKVTPVKGGTSVIEVSANDQAYSTAPLNVQVTVTTSDPVITTGGNVTKVWGDPPFTLLANANTGGKITFTSQNNNVISVSGSTATINGIGQATIVATLPATVNTSEVSATFIVTVVKATPTVGKVDPYEKTTESKPFTVIDKIGSSGERTYISSNPSVATVDRYGTVTIVGVGTCDIQIKSAETATMTEGIQHTTLTVKKASSNDPDDPDDPDNPDEPGGGDDVYVPDDKPGDGGDGDDDKPGDDDDGFRPSDDKPDADTKEPFKPLDEEFNPDKDTDDDGIPDWKDDDIDGDGVLNDEDPDIDGDGILNEDDPDYWLWKEYMDDLDYNIDRVPNDDDPEFIDNPNDTNNTDSETDSFPILPIAIGGGVLLLVAAGVTVTIILVKKRKR